MDDLEEALRNIDVFCKVLVKKMTEDQTQTENKIVVEPMENLLRRKTFIEEPVEPSSLGNHLIPLPLVEEPLIDIFEYSDCVKVLVQCHCKEQKVKLHADIDGVKICKEECHADPDGIQICADECRKLNLPVKYLQIENITARCNNEVLEATIPKIRSSAN